MKTNKIPMLLRSFLDPTPEIKSRIAVLAMTSNWANARHFNILLDDVELLMFGARLRKNVEIEKCSLFFRIAVWNIWQRHKETGSLGVTAEELNALRAMVDIAYDFWSRQSSGVRETARKGLEVYRAQLSEA